MVVPKDGKAPSTLFFQISIMNTAEEGTWSLNIYIMNTLSQQINAVELSKKEKLKVWNKAYRAANKERLNAERRAWYSANKEQIKASRADYSKAYKEANREQLLAYRAANKDYARQKHQAWHKANKEHTKQYSKSYRKNNLGRIKAQSKIYHNNNRELLNKQRCDKLKADPLFKFKCSLRYHSCRAFKRIGQNKPASTESLVGCTWQEAKEHFEKLFQPGMTWSNHGYGKGCWHIDHVIPIATATAAEEAIKLNHISNLQPLWSEDNLAKGAKIQ